MTKVVIEDKEYDSEDMSEESKAQLEALQFVSNEIGRLQLQLAAMQTAKNTYSIALREALQPDGDPAGRSTSITDLGDTISFD